MQNKQVALKWFYNGTMQATTFIAQPTRPIFIGRENCDINIPDNHISRPHARISFDNHEMMLANKSKQNTVTLYEAGLPYDIKPNHKRPIQSGMYFDVWKVRFEVSVLELPQGRHHIQCANSGTILEYGQHRTCPVCGYDLAFARTAF